MWPPFCLTTPCKRALAFVTTFRHNSSKSAGHNFTMWALSCATFSPKEARKCSAAQGPHSEVVPCAFWRLLSKSCDECKGSFARGCEAKRWSHWTCSSLGTIFQPMRINSVPDVKCFSNNKNVLRAKWYDISCATLYNSFVGYKPSLFHTITHKKNQCFFYLSRVQAKPFGAYDWETGPKKCFSLYWLSCITDCSLNK